MSQILLTVRYHVAGNPDAFRASMESVAPAIASVDGLMWKIWGLDSERRQGLSVYLFACQSAANRFAAGPMIERLRQRPDIAEVSLEVAPVDADLSALTGGGPALGTATAAQLREAIA